MHENFYFLITCICFICVCHCINHQRIQSFTSKGRFFRKKMNLKKPNKQMKAVGVWVKGYSLCLQTLMINEDHVNVYLDTPVTKVYLISANFAFRI